MQCPNCGNAIEPNDLFCGECGHKIDRQSQTINSAEKISLMPKLMADDRIQMNH